MKMVNKVWGQEEWIVNTDKYCGKILRLNKEYRCSRHYHKLKDETFYIWSGKVLFELNDKKITLSPGDSVRIHPGDWHRFAGLEESVILEFSTHHKDEDSYRSEPSGRTNEHSNE
jgi:quercetin dioxygenase-like cupin family protein